MWKAFYKYRNLSFKLRLLHMIMFRGQQCFLDNYILRTTVSETTNSRNICHSKCSALIMDVLYNELKNCLRCNQGHPTVCPPQSLFKDHRDVCSSNCPPISFNWPTNHTVFNQMFSCFISLPGYGKLWKGNRKYFRNKFGAWYSFLYPSRLTFHISSYV